MMFRLIGIGTVFALVAVSYSLLLTKGALTRKGCIMPPQPWNATSGKQRRKRTGRTRKRRRKMPACAWTGRQKPRETRRNEHLL